MWLEWLWIGPEVILEWSWGLSGILEWFWGDSGVVPVCACGGSGLFLWLFWSGPGVSLQIWSGSGVTLESVSYTHPTLPMTR